MQSTEKIPVRTEEEDEHHHHDAPIDDAKLDSLLWDLLKICIPIGLVLWASIYLMYRNQFSAWSERVPSSMTRGHAAGHGDGDELGSWIKQEEKVAWREMINNVGPAAGAADGAVVASPSAGEWEDEPDYYFTWTRDSALTMLTISSRFLPQHYLKSWSVPTHTDGDAEMDPDPLIEPLVRAYVSFQQRLQTVKSRSGDLWTGGLNEPKFDVNGTAFEGDWGRPQRDGPALRALALIPYANYLLDRGYPQDIRYVRENIYDPSQIRIAGKVIKNDLEEVAGGWWASGFDLWEEVDGHHLFTLLASLRALQAGSLLARRLWDKGAADFYTAQADMLAQRLQDFRAKDGTWRESMLSDQGSLLDLSQAEGEERQPQAGSFKPLDRTGLDCAVPLAAVHFGSAGQAEFEMSAGQADVLATLREWILSFGGLYRINDGKKWTEGCGVGRYAEDVYNGVGTSRGNPWFICTFTVAHTLYAAATTLSQQEEVIVTNTSIPFWTDLTGHPVDAGDKLSTKIMSKQVRQFDARNVLEALIQVGDAFMRVGQRYADEDGRMSEQFHRSDGMQVGARSLTWSYASFFEAAAARRAARQAVYNV